MVTLPLLLPLLLLERGLLLRGLLRARQRLRGGLRLLVTVVRSHHLALAGRSQLAWEVALGGASRVYLRVLPGRLLKDSILGWIAVLLVGLLAGVLATRESHLRSNRGPFVAEAIAGVTRGSAWVGRRW